MDHHRLRRVFDLLALLARSGPMTVTEASRQLEMPLSSTHDLMRALIAIDAASAVGKGYTVGPRTARLSFDVIDSIGVQRAAQRYLESLSERTGLDVYLAVRTGVRVMYVARCPGTRRQVNIEIPFGRRLYLHSTAVGKLYCAFDRDVHQQMVAGERPVLTPRTRTTLEAIEQDLSAIRLQGFSLSRGESVAGVVGIAAPVWDAHGHLAAAVHVSAPQAAMTQTQLKEVSRQLLDTARGVHGELDRASEDTA